MFYSPILHILIRLIFFCFSPFVFNTGERHMNNCTQNICTLHCFKHSTDIHFTSFSVLFIPFLPSHPVYSCTFFWWTKIWVLLISGGKLGPLFSPPVLSMHIKQHHSLQHSMLLLYKPLFPFYLTSFPWPRIEDKDPPFKWFWPIYLSHLLF